MKEQKLNVIKFEEKNDIKILVNNKFSYIIKKKRRKDTKK